MRINPGETILVIHSNKRGETERADNRLQDDRNFLASIRQVELTKASLHSKIVFQRGKNTLFIQDTVAVFDKIQPPTSNEQPFVKEAFGVV